MAYQTILNDVGSDYGGPYVYYKVEAQYANRTASTVDVDVRVYGRLNNTSSSTWMGSGNVLTGTIVIAGVSKQVTIHAYSDVWRGDDSIGTGWRGPFSTSFTIAGLSESTTALTATFGVKCTYLGSSDTSGQLNTRTCSNITIPTYTTPAPTVNKISVSSLPDFVAGYDGDLVSLSVIPSGGTGYTYAWYRNTTLVGSSQTFSFGLYNNDDYFNGDGLYIYCVVTDSTGGTATTNKCYMRIGRAETQVQVSTHQIEPVQIYNGSKFVPAIPFIGNNYASWNITYTGNNRADIGIIGNAIVG